MNHILTPLTLGSFASGFEFSLLGENASFDVALHNFIGILDGLLFFFRSHVLAIVAATELARASSKLYSKATL